MWSSMIRPEGGEVFLDLKYHDIPNTVAMAGARGLPPWRRGCSMFMPWAAGDDGQNRGRRLTPSFPRGNPERPLLLAVTILTSSTEETLREVGIDRPVEEMVPRLARLAQDAGMDGVVASPREVGLIREACGRDFVIVTPGVRPPLPPCDDQKRVTTPARRSPPAPITW